MILYRIGNRLYRCRIPVLPQLCDLMIRLVHNSAVFSRTSIGYGTIFAYGGIAVVVHPRAIIGKRCVIGPHVTIGGRSKAWGVPVIGSDVFIATGAKILGDIRIGDNSVIGANAVVIDNVPEGSVVVGLPGRVIKCGINARDFF
jgi:serine O-acetyltransferase